MKGPVIIPLDGSGLAEQALPLGMSIAERTGVELLLLRVISAPTVPVQTSKKFITIDELVAAAEEDAEIYLQAVMESLENVKVSYATTVGIAGECIAEVAEERDASYIVMSTHGYTGISRWALGSVADRVLHLTKCPLMIMRPHEGERSLVNISIPDIQRLVVPLDGSPLAEQVLPYAKEFARVHGTELFLFCSVPMPPAIISERNVAFETQIYQKILQPAS